MATGARAGPERSIVADTFETWLAAASVALGLAIAAAVARGRAHWAEVPAIVWLHLLTIGVALALTPYLLLSARGNRQHRTWGRVWAVAMIATAALSFGIHGRGGYGAIQILSGATLLMVPALWWSARRQRVARHRRIVRGTVTGALLVAGLFTFPYGRLLGRWLIG